MKKNHNLKEMLITRARLIKLKISYNFTVSSGNTCNS